MNKPHLISLFSLLAVILTGLYYYSSRWFPFNGCQLTINVQEYENKNLDSNNLSSMKFIKKESEKIIISSPISGSNGRKECQYSTETGKIGKLRLSMFFDNEVQEGIEYHFYNTGNLFATIRFKNGVKHGTMLSWHPDGSLLGVAQFKEGHHDIVSRAWHQNGSIRALAYFKDGKQYMFEKQFYPNGQLKAYAPMKLGEIHGLARTWYENGTVQSEVIHIHGIAQTNGKFYDIDGKLMPEKIRARPKFSH